MKKTLLYALLFSSAMNAQIREVGNLEIAPFFGVSFANYYGGNISMTNNKPIGAPYFGITLDSYLHNRWSIRTGVEYQIQGTKAQDVYLGLGMKEVKEKLSFISIPIHANYHFGKIRNFNLNFGPTLSFLTAAKLDSFDIKERITSVHWGMGIGIGYKFSINESFSIGIDHQEYISFTNNIKKGYDEDNISRKNYFGSFTIKAIFILEKNKK